eukprot:GHVU01016748.1.p1 GENE.GHVU01016748.1~~GHVU01016748.1.p1  ORF type:complete len:226 (-),score=31.28 GHVU01016748.1:712-1389(-)
MSAPAALVPESRAEQPLPVCGSEVTMLREKEEKEQRRGVMMSLITEFFPNEEESDLEGILFNPETRVFLFQAEDGVVVGLATVERMKRTGQDEKTETSAYYLHHLCVRDEWQRKGVARKICGAMAEVRGWSSAEECACLQGVMVVHCRQLERTRCMSTRLCAKLRFGSQSRARRRRGPSKCSLESASSAQVSGVVSLVVGGRSCWAATGATRGTPVYAYIYYTRH